MNWLDSSSFSGLLSQAQKSIDKVLDIPSEEGSTSIKSGQNSEKVLSSQSPKNQEKKAAEQKSSSSWLSGADSFWGSITQNVSSSPKKETQEKNEKSSDALEETDTTFEKEKANDARPKESKLPTTNKALNLKRNSKKKVSKKDVETSNSHLNQASPTKRTQEREAGTRNKTLNNSKEVLLKRTEKKLDVDFTDSKTDANSKDSLDSNNFSNDILLSKSDTIVSENEKRVNEENYPEMKEIEPAVALEKGEGALVAENVDVVNEKQVGKNLGYENEENKHVENIDVLVKERKNLVGSGDVITNFDNEATDGMVNETKNFKKVEQDKRSNSDLKSAEVAEETIATGNIEAGQENGESGEENGESGKKNVESGEEDIEAGDLFSSPPIAASTPFAVQKKELLLHNTDNDDTVTNLNEFLKASELTENEYSEYKVTDVKNESVKDPDIDQDGIRKVNDGGKVSKEEIDEVTSEQVKENDRLLQIIEVREAKLVELSKENLNLQETNAILRSQIEQLEEVHKSEDDELEQMKYEFTKRIGESESKLQAAAKERDLFKKQLEETQKCLSSDIERQLKEFQSLLQEKDEQIAQLMEEGEKLSKQILQRNNNIKKLRAKEKELNAANESQRTRLEAAESEIERLNEILKERDEHEKEQDDAIKKLNAYTKQQEDLIAKQKVELEESAAKLPSLQTALDNAYKEITELNKVNAAKSTEVQEATLSVEMTAKEELRIALEKLKKASQKECDVLAMEVNDLQTQLSRSEQQAARREENLRQEIADAQMRLQEAETRNQELTQSVSVATRPLLRQIENLQHSYSSQQTSWEKLERNLTERLANVQSQLATAQEKERASTERSIEISSKVASLESQVSNYRQEKSRIEAEFELEKAKLETLEEYRSKESGKVEALKTVHSKQLDRLMVEKSLLEQQLVVERTKYESEQKKMAKLEEQLKERSQRVQDIGEVENEDPAIHTTLERRQSRNSSSSSVFSLSDTMTRSLPSGGTAVLEELRATIRHKEGELASMQSGISTLESSRESLTQELTSLMNVNENLSKENRQLRHIGSSFQELQTKYNALLQMYGEKQEETEELKLDLQDIKNMYKAQIQELLSGR